MNISSINVNGTTHNIIDDEAMRIVSNPTADNILVMDADGQAVDSGTSLSDITSGISDAIGTLDGSVTGTPGADKTLVSFDETDGVVSAEFDNISITKSQVSDFSHAHGNITNGGDITTNVAIASGDRLVINDESASKINSSSITFGSTTTTFLSNKGTWLTPGYGMNAGSKLCNKSGTGTQSWTATADCFVYAQGSAYGSIKVGGTQLAGSSSGNFSPNPMYFPVKKGDAVAVAGSYTNYIWAWGIKY